MSTFEFVTVLLSIVVGLGLTRLLGGLGRAIEIRGELKLYWVQAIWSVNVGLYLVIFWWAVVFSYSGLETWLFINFAHLILYAVLLYLQTVLIIPSNLKPGTDLEAHFYSIRPWFFLIGVLLPLVEITDSLLHGLSNLLALGPFYILMQGFGVIWALVAMRTANRTFHAVWCLVYLGSMLAWTSSQFWSIG